MIYNIDLYSRFEAAFGFVAANAVALMETQLVKSNMTSFEVGDRTFANITLTAVNAKKQFKFELPAKTEKLKGIDAGVEMLGFNDGSSSAFLGLTAPPPMVSFSREKNISRTIIDNSDYEVIENFGKKSWNIQIEGILVDTENHWYPQELLRKVHEMFDIDEVLEVVSTVFSDLDICSIYFDRIDNLSFVDGFNDTIRYKLTAYSIKPTEFENL
jgi:hypothetical protein